ncbi:hypothetical protein EMCRGX_G014184, partial [Ephydatia muelleri]
MFNYLLFVHITAFSPYYQMGCVTNPFLPMYVGWSHSPRSLNTCSCQSFWYSLYLSVSFARDEAALSVMKAGGLQKRRPKQAVWACELAKYLYNQIHTLLHLTILIHLKCTVFS